MPPKMEFWQKGAFKPLFFRKIFTNKKLIQKKKRENIPLINVIRWFWQIFGDCHFSPFFNPCAKSVAFSQKSDILNKIPCEISFLKNCILSLLYLISFEVTTKTIIKKSYKIERVAPSLPAFNARFIQDVRTYIMILHSICVNFIPLWKEVMSQCVAWSLCFSTLPFWKQQQHGAYFSTQYLCYSDLGLFKCTQCSDITIIFRLGESSGWSQHCKKADFKNKMCIWV